MPTHRHTFVRKQPKIALFLLNEKKGILLGVARYIRRFARWQLFLQPTEDKAGLPQWLSGWRGDGIIGRIVNQSTAELVLSTGLPFVDVRGGVRDPRIPLVRVDDAAVGRLAAGHLIERGYTNFGYFGPTKADWALARRDAFSQAVAEAGGQIHCYEQSPIASSPTGWDQAERQLADWLVSLPKPLALLAASDAYGQRLLSAARRVDLKVPEQLAVVGVDDDQAICEVCDPPLSSVIIDSEQLGYKAAELLDRLMAGEPPPTQPLLVPPTGVRPRQSTDILAIDDPNILDAVRFIREHACEGIGVSDVLRMVPVSRSVLQRQFRRRFGQSANDMIVATRLKRAQQLLVETDWSIAHIAETTGFRYQRYLGAVFRKKLGMTPFKYRQNAGPGRRIETQQHPPPQVGPWVQKSSQSPSLEPSSRAARRE